MNVTAATTTSAINAIISAYSTAVAPSSGSSAAASQVRRRTYNSVTLQHPLRCLRSCRAAVGRRTARPRRLTLGHRHTGAPSLGVSGYAPAMDGEARDRVALVTGAGSPDGIGFATARVLGREGARL